MFGGGVVAYHVTKELHLVQGKSHSEPMGSTNERVVKYKLKEEWAFNWVV